MITIPICVFVILVTLSSIFTLIVGISIVSYINYCRLQKREKGKYLEENYGTTYKD